MARFADEVIERIKAEVSLVRLVESQGYTLVKQGKDVALCCPFHADKTPSCVISRKSNLFNCFGCGAGGSVIDWVMKTQGVSFRHAVELLKNDVAAIASPSAAEAPIKKASVPKLAAPVAVGADDQTALREVVDYYHETLMQSVEAIAYLEERGLAEGELIKHFKLGYANRTLGLRLPLKNRKAGAELREQLQRLGVYRENGREHLNGSIVVPLWGEAGEVVQLYGRKVSDKLRVGTPSHLYLPQPQAGVFNREALPGCEEVILCEALLDALTFWRWGFRNVTSSFGVHGFTDELLQCFKALGIRRVLIAYDRDEAGNTAAEALATRLGAEGFSCYRVLFPKGMDANSYAQQMVPPAKALALVIRQAEWMCGVERRMESSPELPPHTVIAPQKTVVAEPAKPSPPVAKTAAKTTVVVEPPQSDLPASVMPPAPVETVVPVVSEHEVSVQFGERRYRVRGLQKNTSYDVLKVNLLFATNDVVHVDTFDFYSAKHRQAFAKLAALESGLDEKILQRDLGQLLLQLEGLQDQSIQAALAPKTEPAYAMSDAEREAALSLLCDPDLANRIVSDFALTGLVGEPANALMGYVAAVSRKLKNPLAIIVQSTSAAGKSALMDAVLRLLPEEDRIQYSAMTGQSLFYLGETNLKHKVLAIAEEEGVRQAAYALKLLQSQGELTIASTGKDPHSGKLVTEEYRVEGPVMLFLTTTAIDIDEELLNRCVVLTINESREQTAAIQQRQRQARTLSGLLANREADACIQQHRNAQRLLKPLAVVNPYAEQLRFADSRTRTRRDHEKYLTLIDTIALLHQFQRKVKTLNHDGHAVDYIEVIPTDIALANQLAHEILGRSLDELPPPTRQLLNCLQAWVKTVMECDGLRRHDVRFSRKELREVSGLSNTQLGVHLTRLVELEYVYAHGGRNGQRYVYELVFDGEADTEMPQLMGLIDVGQLGKEPPHARTMENLTALTPDLTDSLRPASGVLTASLRPSENDRKANAGAALATVESSVPPKHLSAVKRQSASYTQVNEV